MTPRTLPPVHSPLTFRAVVRGWSGMVVGRESALAQARALLLRQFGARDLLLTESGTSALALALRMAVSLTPERPRVALPAWGCYDLATAADAAEVGVVLYDIDPGTLGPDWSSLERALGTGVAAVVVVHAYGLPVHLPEVAARATPAGSLVIEDAAQAVGATLGTHPAGTSGALGVLSFGRGKGWTGGGGGALLLNPAAPTTLRLHGPETLLRPARGLASAVKLTAQWLLARPALYALPSAMPFLQLGQTVYRQAAPPAGMTAAEAAVLLATAALQGHEADLRRATAERLRSAVEGSGAGRIPLGWAGATPGWLRLPMLPSDPILRRASSAEARRLGIMPGYPLPLAELRGFSARIQSDPTAFPGARELAARLHTLPTHGQLTGTDLERLEAWLVSG